MSNNGKIQLLKSVKEELRAYKKLHPAADYDDIMNYLSNILARYKYIRDMKGEQNVS